MTRAIQGLISAAPCARPKGIPHGRPRGRKAAGLRYERALARALPEATHGQWFWFQDAFGPGHCQTDLLIPGPGGAIVVLEAKYTWTQAGHEQIARLYKPVLERAYRRQVCGLVVCKVLTGDTPRDWVCRDLETATARALSGLPTVLHWIGVGLGPLRMAT